MVWAAIGRPFSIKLIKLFVSQGDNLVKKFVELIAGTTQALHDIDRPLDVFDATLFVPILCRAGDDVADIADLIGEFDDLCTIR